MSAATCLAADVGFGAADRAPLFPLSRQRFFGRRFGCSRSPQPLEPWFVGLLNGALGMDSADGVRRRSADGTEILWRRWLDGHRFFFIHRFSKLAGWQLHCAGLCRGIVAARSDLFKKLAARVIARGQCGFHLCDCLIADRRLNFGRRDRRRNRPRLHPRAILWAGPH